MEFAKKAKLVFGVNVTTWRPSKLRLVGSVIGNKTNNTHRRPMGIAGTLHMVHVLVTRCRHCDIDPIDFDVPTLDAQHRSSYYFSLLWDHGAASTHVNLLGISAPYLLPALSYLIAALASNFLSLISLDYRVDFNRRYIDGKLKLR